MLQVLTLALALTQTLTLTLTLTLALTHLHVLDHAARDLGAAFIPVLELVLRPRPSVVGRATYLHAHEGGVADLVRVRVRVEG